MSRRLWTDADLRLFAEIWPTTPGKDVAARLGRSIAVCYMKASELGLRKAKLGREQAAPKERAPQPRPTPAPTARKDRIIRAAAQALICQGVDDVAAHMVVGIISRGEVPELRLEMPGQAA